MASTAGYKLTPEQRRQIVAEALADGADLKQVAARWGITRARVSQLTLKAGYRRRRGDGKPKITWNCPPQLDEMYCTLSAKVGPREARRLIEDHMRQKGIKAP